MSDQLRGALDIDTSGILPPGRKFLFGIGIDDYDDMPDLQNAVKDLDDVVAVLLDKYDFDASRVKLLKNKEATHDNILDELHEYTGKYKLGIDDSLLIYFSGHGHLDHDYGYWVPADAAPYKISKLIPNADVQRCIRNMNCRHVLLISDSCFSGSLLLRERSVSSAHPEADELESQNSRWIISSGRANEAVQDGVGENSPFAKAILDQLRRNDNPKLLSEDLARKLRYDTRENAKQMPQYGKLDVPGANDGQFIFYLRDREADDWKSAKVINSVEAFESFRKRYPNGAHATEAKAHIDALIEKAAWEKVCQYDTPGGYDQFMNSYPQSSYLPEAQRKLEDAEDRRGWMRAKRFGTIAAFREYKAKHPDGQFLVEAAAEITKIHEQEKEDLQAEQAEIEKQREDEIRKQEEIALLEQKETERLRVKQEAKRIHREQEARKLEAEKQRQEEVEKMKKKAELDKTKEPVVKTKNENKSQKTYTMLTPLEIRQQTFETTFRGYNREHVDAFLTVLSQEWERLHIELQNLRDQILELKDKMP